MTILKYLSTDNNIHQLSPGLQRAILKAQDNSFEGAFDTAADYIAATLSQLRLAIDVSPDLAHQEPSAIADKSFGELYRFFSELLAAQNYPEQAIARTAASSATRAMLLRAFDNPDLAINMIRDKVVAVVGMLPAKAADLEVGRNKGDVLDPFILAATQFLLYGGEFTGAITATVSHKALMIIEGLMGHLHEDVLGMMRGNVRVPEPRGDDQETFDHKINPFPGADLIQPPTQNGGRLRIHQIKSKTGSAKGGDGKRLGDQLFFLSQHYDADIFYDALVGNTLRGHRSKTGVEKAAPKIRVLVGQAAFLQLTGSRHGAAMLLRIYQEAFIATAASTGYSIATITEAIVEHFRKKSEEAGEAFLDTILESSTGGAIEEQDNLYFNSREK
jgi:hypothetical protein